MVDGFTTGVERLVVAEVLALPVALELVLDEVGFIAGFGLDALAEAAAFRTVVAGAVALPRFSASVSVLTGEW